VLQAIVNGACNAEIAESLNIAQETVKTHVKNILHS
jgi:DNA-binding NarL/FixJ family response regulator